MPYRNVCKDIFKSSDLIYKRKYNFNKTNLFTSLERLYRIKTSEILERNDPSKAEFITIKAWKSN